MSAGTGKPRTNSLQIIQLECFADLSWVVHGFSTRRGGFSQVYGGNALNLGYTEHDTRDAVNRNRELFLEALGTSNWPIIGTRQIHSSVVHCVSGFSGNGQAHADVSHLPAGDGLITDVQGVLLGVKTADCLPILLADARQRVVGALHAGWRGTVARIAEKGVGEMRKAFGSRPEHIRAAIGPGVHRCCYEVGEEVRQQFASQFDYADTLFEEVADDNEIHRKYPLMFMNMRAPGHGEPPRKLHLDLVEANRRQLLAAGVPPGNIAISELCTACRTDLLFSHRAEKGRTGRLLAVIGIRAGLNSTGC